MTNPKQRIRSKSKALNPLDAYTTGIETLMRAARGDDITDTQIEAARELLAHTAVPPTLNWDFEED